MGGLLGGLLGKKPKAPPVPKVPDPPAVPVVSDEAEEWAAREEKRKSGISKTFLTGNLAPTASGKKRTLG